MIKRIMSFTIVLCMILTLVPTFAYQNPFIDPLAISHDAAHPGDNGYLEATYRVVDADTNIMAIDVAMFNASANTMSFYFKYDKSIVKACDPDGALADGDASAAVIGATMDSTITSYATYLSALNTAQWMMFPSLTNDESGAMGYIKADASTNATKTTTIKGRFPLWNQVSNNFTAPATGLKLYSAYFIAAEGKTLADVTKTTFSTLEGNATVPTGVKLGSAAVCQGHKVEWTNFPEAVDQPQDAPTGLGSVAPTTASNNDGKITNVSDLMEYKLATDSTYTSVTAAATQITGLAAGSYNVRLKAKTGFLASPDATVVVTAYVAPNVDQAAPAANLFTATAPTVALNDGIIAGTNATMEYKKVGDSSYTVTGTSITSLTAGDYLIRYAAKSGYNASPDTSVNVPAFQAANQAAPAANLFTATAPTVALNDGIISGTNATMEYKKVGDPSYTVTGASITGLTAGDYLIRYAAKSGFNASPDTTVNVPAFVPASQVAPAANLFTATIPTVALNDGIISGTNATMEYKKSGTPDAYVVTGTSITGLTAGDYLIRYAAKSGYNASPDTTVTVGAYVPNADQVAPAANLFTATRPTAALNDGIIAGTDATMEYKKVGTPAYVVTGTSITGLTAGDYLIRYAAKTGFNASPSTTVTVLPYEAPPIEGAAVTAGNVPNGYIGQTVIVPITITDMTGLNNYDVAISYKNTVLQLVKVEPAIANAPAPAIHEETVGTDNKIGMSGFIGGSGATGLIGNIVVLNVTFTIIAGIDPGETYVNVLAGRYNSSDVIAANLVAGKITYTNATDPLVTAALTAVANYEAVVVSGLTKNQINAILTSGLGKLAQDAVYAISAESSAAAKQALQVRVNTKNDALNAEILELDKEATAAAAVLAYENAPLLNLTDVGSAELLKAAAYSAVGLIRTGTLFETNLLDRLDIKDAAVTLAKTNLTKAKAVTDINAGAATNVATYAQYLILSLSADETKVVNYNRGVAALGSNLTEAQIIALITQVNAPVAPVITNVTIVGQAVVGEELTVTYSYFDANYDLDAGQTIIWSIGGTPVTASTHLVVAGDVGKTITVSVATVSSSATPAVLLRGDVTGDGEIHSDDAYSIREIAVGLGSYTDQQKEAGNWDNDADTDVIDSSNVLIAAAASIIPVG